MKAKTTVAGALALAIAATACGAQLPESASNPAPSGDIRQQVMAALEQPGTVTHALRGLE